MKRFALLLAFFTILVSTGKSQITIDSADLAKYYEPGKYQHHFGAENIPVNVGTASSTEQNFSFTFEPTQSVVFTNYMLWPWLGIEPFSKFPDATHATGFSVPLQIGEDTTFTTTVYQFVKISNESIVALGIALRQQFTPAMPPLPADTMTYDYTSEFMAHLPIAYGATQIYGDTTYDWINSGNYTITKTVQKADGYGTITIPQGTYPALRISYVIVESHYSAPATEPHTVDSTVTITFLTNEGVRVELDIADGQPYEGETYATGAAIVVTSGSATSVRNDVGATVKGFALNQNFPNPFNPSTTLSFSLPQSGMTTLKVYDIIGKEVASLIDEDLTAGLYSVPFNASHLPSGVYFYTLHSGNYRMTKKMALVK